MAIPASSRSNRSTQKHKIGSIFAYHKPSTNWALVGDSARSSDLADNLVIVPVLRAGLAMLAAAQDLLIDVPVGFLGLERDEETAIAREYYRKFPSSLTIQHT